MARDRQAVRDLAVLTGYSGALSALVVGTAGLCIAAVAVIEGMPSQLLALALVPVAAVPTTWAVTQLSDEAAQAAARLDALHWAPSTLAMSLLVSAAAVLIAIVGSSLVGLALLVIAVPVGVVVQATHLALTRTR